MDSKSRIKKYERRKALLRIFGSVVLIAFLIIVFIKFMPNIIINISSIAARVGQNKENADKNKADFTAPFPPQLDPVPGALAQKTIKISGSAEPLSLVAIYLNDTQTKEIKAEKSGKFNITLQLFEGENKVSAEAKDESGNISSMSQSKIILVKTSGPDLEVNFEVDKENAKVKITGTTDADAKININQRRVVVSRSGNFDGEFNLSNGENIFLISAKDDAGNETTKELAVDYSSEEEK